MRARGKPHWGKESKRRAARQRKIFAEEKGRFMEQKAIEIEAAEKPGVIPPWEGPDEFEAGLHPGGSGVAPVLESAQTRKPLAYLGDDRKAERAREQAAELRRNAWRSGPLGGNHRPIPPITSHDLDEVI